MIGATKPETLPADAWYWLGSSLVRPRRLVEFSGMGACFSKRDELHLEDWYTGQETAGRVKAIKLALFEDGYR